jgi:alpha-L-fucosidase
MTRREMLKSTAGLIGSAAMAGEGKILAAQEKPIPAPAPRIARFERLGLGIFMHFGLYSQYERGEWTENIHKVPRDEYLKKMETFTAKDFHGREFARLAKRAGAKYITLTSRHHEGFSLYDTLGLSPLDVTHTPCKRDLIKDFVEGCRAKSILPMLYHTTLDWNDPRFESDFPAYLKYLRDSVELLCTRYGPIGGFWFDGNWSKPKADWQEDQLYAVIRRHQPEAMIINNTGIDALGKLGNPELDSVTFERGRPTPLDRRGAPKYIAAEMCHTLNFHWGTAAKDFNYLSPAHVIEELCYARRAGANLLMNFGPTATGGIPEYEGAALHKVGDWIRLMGGDDGPIYQGRPAGIAGEGEDFGLMVGNNLYLFVFDLTPTSDTRVHTKSRGAGPRTFEGVAGHYDTASWLDNGEPLKLEQDSSTITLHATAFPYGVNTVVRVAKLPRL